MKKGWNFEKGLNLNSEIRIDLGHTFIIWIDFFKIGMFEKNLIQIIKKRIVKT